MAKSKLLVGLQIKGFSDITDRYYRQHRKILLMKIIHFVNILRGRVKILLCPERGPRPPAPLPTPNAIQGSDMKNVMGTKKSSIPWG